jgi:ATP-dependent Clp protease ATP-binding subunit ClpA
MSELITAAIGFAPARGLNLVEDDLDQKIHRTALEAARRKFSPEFMNRIDRVVVFRSLKREELRQILELELIAVQRRINRRSSARLNIKLTEQAMELLLAEGTEYRYGARHLKRAIERLLVFPLASLSATGQVRLNDMLVVDTDSQNSRFAFFRDDAIATAVTKRLEPAAANNSEIRIAA